MPIDYLPADFGAALLIEAINTEHLAKGIYLYEVRSKNGVIKKGKVIHR